MVSVGFLIRVEAKPDRVQDVERVDIVAATLAGE